MPEIREFEENFDLELEQGTSTSPDLGTPAKGVPAFDAAKNLEELLQSAKLGSMATESAPDLAQRSIDQALQQYRDLLSSVEGLFN